MGVTPEQSRAALYALIEARVGSEQAKWLAGHAGEASTVRAAMAEIGRTLGRKPLVGAFAERAHATVEGVWGALPVGAWRVDEAARTWLLATAAGGGDAPYAALFELYDLGDTDTRVAALHALNFVGGGDVERGLDLIADAGRTYLDPLLKAAWCDNPFAAEHMSDEAYRAAVLKALFCEVPVEGFIGLSARADASLAASLYDYADEREAAGRSVPAAVWTVAALHPRPGLVARLIGRLEHPLPAERRVAAEALANARDPRARSFIDERIEREQDAAVTEALERARAAVDS